MNDTSPRILLVDDQPARLLSYEAILGDLPVRLVRANSGVEALHRLMSAEYAVILLDVNMPGMDGFETASLIHQHPRFEKTPIIFVTGVHVTDLDQLRGYKLGAVDYVYIPVIPEILRSKISVLVELYSHRRELQHLNLSLATANAQLESANNLLRAEKTQELQALNEALAVTNTRLEDANRTLQIESRERGLAEDRMRFLADTIPSIVWTCDPKGNVTYANRNWYRYYGVSETDAPGSLINLALHPDEAAAISTKVTASLEKGVPFEFEARHRNGDSSFSWFISRAVPWRGPLGNIESWFGVTTNIDEQKRMMEQLRDADRRKDEFLAVLSHELRNPLAPIRNAVEVMRLIGLPGHQLPALRDMIERQSVHLTRLVDDLLDVSRISRGKIDLSREVLALDDVLAAAVEVCRPLIDSRSLKLSIELPATPLSVHGDLTRLAQIFGNLLNNAAKYSADGSQISITAKRVDSQVMVSIRDIGAGIPPDMLESIFDPFVQVEATRSHSRGGLGIGLPLVRQLLDLHGGTIEARSAGLGRGSEFVVTLPLHEVRTPILEPVASVTDTSSRRRILIADDNCDARMSLALSLELLGHEVYLAADGVEALEIAGLKHPEVALIDLGMPCMDGFEVARHLRSEPWGREVKLIALTGWSRESIKSSMIDFDAHCVKPVPLDLLVKTISPDVTGPKVKRVSV